jgi:exonuclease SbcC
MTLSIGELREHVAAHNGFSEVEQIGDSVIRAVREWEKSPFAVYYFDIAEDLPRTQEMLISYQDRVIGGRYFDGRKSLQWSNYLYFLTTPDRFRSSAVKRAKELIELDRTYARKFVIVEQEIDSVLNPPVVTASGNAPHQNVLSIWSDWLSKKNLDGVILSDDDIPARLRLIEHPLPKEPKFVKTRAQAWRVEPAPSINSIYLKRYDRFPIERKFKFGKVNLIFGPNGSGKTSLLEAIELFYCGRNKRNPNSQVTYELVADLSDGRTEMATNDRTLQQFRDRNLNWYGQPEVKTNRLYLSFAQFNFLDTDAAVSLSDSTERLEEDLSNLLIGPEAAKTWHDIERVSDALSSKLRELEPLKQQITEELSVLDSQLQAKNSIPSESESIGSRLNEILKRLGWLVNLKRADLENSFVGSLSELRSVTQQLVAIDWLEAPVSLKALSAYRLSIKHLIEGAETDVSKLESVLTRQTRLAATHRNDLAAKGIAEEASVLVERGIPKRISERGKDQALLTSHYQLLNAYDSEALTRGLSKYLDLTVQSVHEIAAQNFTVAEDELVRVKAEHLEFVRLQDEATSLGQQLRQIATKIFNITSRTDECPLCHTTFAPGELQRHMNKGVDELIEARTQPRLDEVQQKEEALESARSSKVASDWLKAFVERASLSPDVSVQTALSKLKELSEQESEIRTRLETLESELKTLESEGLSGMELEEITLRLEQLGYPLAEFSRDAVQGVLLKINQKLADSSRAIESDRREAEELQANLMNTMRLAGLRIEESDVDLFKRALSRLKEQLTSTEVLTEKLMALLTSFPWPPHKPLAELEVESESTRSIAAEYQSALRREAEAQAAYSESSRRKKKLQRQLNDLTPRIDRFTAAQNDLTDLMKEHSLAAAMTEALEENKSSIELIFSRIHSPAEFRGLGAKWTTLVRKGDGTKAELSEISTGQRAAFALSIFLAQNAQLTKAPPVILIDDPIAHIDDLNSLSFLDYLREIILTGRRQIFLATANDKLATLFERKFDFLGQEDFYRFNLTPHPMISS